MQESKAGIVVQKIIAAISGFFSRLGPAAKKASGNITKGLNDLKNALQEVKVRVGARFSQIRKVLSELNKKLSPPKWVLPARVIYFFAIFMFSFLVIALETLNFHILQLVTSYLHSTLIIGIALLGIAMGSLISFYLGRFNIMRIMFVSAILLFFSIILGYYNVLNIGEYRFPFFMIFPFLFASIIITSVFTLQNTNFMYFANLTASALGVIFPVLFLPLFKSETSLMLIMLIPLVFVFIQSFGIANIPLKSVLAVASLICIIQFGGLIDRNLATPDRIESFVYENKILQEFDQDAERRFFIKNIPLEFIERVYRYNSLMDRYEFHGDEYDARRVKYLLQRLGYLKRWGLGRVPLMNGKKIILKDFHSMDAAFFNFELRHALELKYNTYFDRNYDYLFLARVYKKGGDGYYHMVGNGYDRKRAKYLLTELGHIETIDLNFDVRYHESFTEDKKIYTKPERILLSEDSVLGRVEYTGNISGGSEDLNIDLDKFFFYLNGVFIDTVNPRKGSEKDPRVPWLTMDEPKMFIVGLSADGTVKSNNQIPGAKVCGIELNPIVLRTMSEEGPFSFAGAMPYENTLVFHGEGRSFLENSKQKFDSIYLMNIHTEHGPISTLSPEYFHTVEGTELLLNRISPAGYIVYQEIIENFRGQTALYKMMNTIKTAMRKIGIADPTRHIFIYSWGLNRYSEEYRTIIIKRTPFSQNEKPVLDEYLDTVRSATPYSAYNLQMVYDPYGKRFGNEVEKYIIDDLYYMMYLPRRLSSYQFTSEIINRLSDPEDIQFMYNTYTYNGTTDRFEVAGNSLGQQKEFRLIQILNKAGYPYEYDLSPITDNKPFPYNVYARKTEIFRIFNIVLVLSLLLIVPCLLIMLNKVELYRKHLVVPNLYAAVLGFAYIITEIVLMQVFQRFLGVPDIAFIVVLGALLLFSGIGSFISRYLKPGVNRLLVALIPLFLLLLSFFADDIFLCFADKDYNQKIIVTLMLLFPITFLMGIPFPNAAEVVKKQTSREYVSLMFAISSGFSTIGATTGIILNVSFGYTSSYVIAIVCYLAVLFLFSWILRTGKACPP
ncbi:MAG: hypothetical protein JW874_07710 [Spirochaetales bacterium]|nr:hypothetical protein [Spirochaetales bacterium]